MAIEVEARFRITDPAAATRLAGLTRLGPATLGLASDAHETDDYLDTAGGALAAARWACRLRPRDGTVIVSMKGPPEAGTGGWLHRRPELEGPATAELLPERWPRSDARELLDRLRRGQPLLTRLTLRQHRVERSVALAGELVGVLTVDAVMVIEAGQAVGEFGIVELELAGDDARAPSLLPELADALAAVGGLVEEPRSKLEQALGMVAPS
jgi:inorganic triphosphatase YgiF